MHGKLIKVGRTIAAVLAAASLTLTAGCANRTHTAFSVDGAVTSLTQVSSMLDACNGVFKGTPYDGQLTSQWIVNEMIHSQLAYLVAAQKSIASSDDALHQTLMSNPSAPRWQVLMLNDPQCGTLALGLTLEQLANYQLGSGPYTALASAHVIVVNPRFGVWDAAQGSIVGSGSLSSPDSTGG